LEQFCKTQPQSTFINNKNLSPEDTGIILELSQKLDIAVAKCLAKGHEQKFYIETTQGEKRMLRIWDAESRIWLEGDTRMYEYVAAAGINISQPVDVDAFCGGALSYQLFTWLDGEDLIDALPRMNPNEQFLTGIKTGQLMRKLHTLPPRQGCDIESWELRFGRKLQTIIEPYKEKPSKSQAVDLLLQYLQDNQELLDNRPQTFTHGDWDTENLIYTPDGQIGIIDLSGANDYGDPWLDFWHTPHDLNQSPQFYIGQIKGYFEGEPPLEFFRLLSYYIAFVTLEWNPDKAKCILDWFDGMRNPVPTWYLSYME